MVKRTPLLVLLLLAIFGILDAGYLTWEHYSNMIPPCSTNWWVDCGKVLQSIYSLWWGIPLALFGVLQYITVFFLVFSLLLRWKQKIGWWLVAQTTLGLLFSLYFVWLQLVVIQAICLYCMASAGISTVLFFVALHSVQDKRIGILWIMGWIYQHIVKHIFFLVNPETIHVLIVHLGELIGTQSWLTNGMKTIFAPPLPSLQQHIAGLQLATPLGLAAGFDYEARLTQTLWPLGFGFQTVGTITYDPCEGNAKPRLARLPKSQSLLVNKGFKNPGAKAVIQKLEGAHFTIPVGISIGQTNNKTFSSRKEVVDEIVASFQLFEKSEMKHAYYELNISCPNIQKSFDFYEPKNLDQLLKAIDALHVKRPIFVKMPISEPNETILQLLEVITIHSVNGVILGNLQKNRLDPSIDPGERAKLGKGNLSGKPTFERSNQLISLAYRHFGKKLMIIGCGGVFTAQDAYAKIRLGASLIHMITGMIFMGPQVIAQIQAELADLLKRDGFTSISQAVGVDNKKTNGIKKG